MIRDFIIRVPANTIINMIRELTPKECEEAFKVGIVQAFHEYCASSITNEDIWDICTETITELEAEEVFESIFGGVFKNEKNLS